VKHLTEAFLEAKRVAPDDRAAAMLCVAAAVGDLTSLLKGFSDNGEISYEVKKGVREAIFGIGADEDASLTTSATEITQAINELRDAMKRT
jgi:hypothetical protein